MNRYTITTGQSGYPQPENDFGYIDATYDCSNACLTCNVGLIQKNEFRFRSEPKSAHSQFLGLNWVFDEVFVRRSVVEAFLTENITGLAFSQPVIHKTGVAIDGIYQLRVHNLLTTGLITDNLASEICELPKKSGFLKFLKANKSKLADGPFCGRIKYNYPIGNNYLKINKNALDDQPDFIRLAYNFGSGGASGRPVLVSERVKQLIEKEKWRGAFLRPVELV